MNKFKITYLQSGLVRAIIIESYDISGAISAAPGYGVMNSDIVKVEKLMEALPSETYDHTTPEG